MTEFLVTVTMGRTHIIFEVHRAEENPILQGRSLLVEQNHENKQVERQKNLNSLLEVIPRT